MKIMLNRMKHFACKKCSNLEQLRSTFFFKVKLHSLVSNSIKIAPHQSIIAQV